ncbi:hypothetical protein [Candidatus Manganitrophus noduliformans]|uniref:Uncharacterized protein n=1 Tax=Candidatus Manganitrophus noduliformans TaxID=2606439 RepID=A0A7X6DMP6_9BACT|nr:hypothetical protein [Candidatus Manganitrophus noduliformans]NKE69937.1 hypothetical protein [Candidatus Manganitrophus noduliformans]
MGWLDALFQRKPTANPAVKSLRRNQGTLDPKIEEIITLLPKMGETVRQGADYLFMKVLQEQIRNYDARFGSKVVDQIDDSKKSAILRKLTGLMLVALFNELSEQYPDSPIPSALTDAVHYEIYRALPSKDSFIDYLTYRNPNFEDPRLAPAFKFGNDIAEIMQTLDLSFSFTISQQTMIISDISRKLIRLVLFDEPIETAPQSP